MVDDLVFHELLWLGLLWFCVIVIWVRPQLRAGTGHTQHKAATPTTRRSTDPKLFVGLTHKPHCAACEHAAQALTDQRPTFPPLLLVSSRGRRREVATPHQFCPKLTCRYYGWVERGNIRADGHPGGGPWRQLPCLACHSYFQETHGTPLHGKHVSAERLVWAVAALAEGLGIRAVARMFEVDPNTVLQWLVKAAEPLQTFSQYFLHDVQVSQVPLDELFAWLSAVKAGRVSNDEAIVCLERSPYWVWAAIDPESKLLLSINIGERTLAMAQQLVHQVVQVLAPGCVPLFLTDGFREYTTALLTHFGHWVQPSRRQATGPTPKPRWMPLPQLPYAQVVKSYRRRRVVRVRHRVVFGTLTSVNRILATTGWQINTAFIERVNLTIRQHVAAVGRRVITLCKGKEGLRQQLALYHAYYNFCLPHASLRLPLLQPEPTNGNGSAKQWRPRTPAMAADLTDHVWTLREVLLFRVPPWPQPQAL